MEGVQCRGVWLEIANTQFIEREKRTEREVGAIIHSKH